MPMISNRMLITKYEADANKAFRRKVRTHTFE